MAKLDLISIGDASLDVFISPIESEALCEIDKKKCYVCFSYGEKIPVKEMEFSIGGNAANNAVGTKRLGVNVGVVLTLGDDDIGKEIIEKLENENVDTTFVFQQPATTSNYSTVINYTGERTIFTYKSPQSYQYPVKLPITSWVYLTSMGDTFKPFYNHLISFLRYNPQIKLAYNPGSRQLRVPLKEIEDMIKITHTLFVNREEAEKLTGFSQSLGKEKELLNALVSLGVKNPVVTDGNNGSFVFDGAKYLKLGILPIDAYERTGAGDAFGSGCLAALIKGKGFNEALIWGTVNSASVIGYTGSQKGLLRESEITEWLERARSSSLAVVEF
ncbi:MAG TPA: carbohydrate kinase family protein [Patescibacteria group bacterium]|nr:carbohydrate kinase family protein [Patescibacteria group bacterium]